MRPKEIRILRGEMSREEFGRELGGVSYVTIRNWEIGATRPVGLFKKALLDYVAKQKNQKPQPVV